MVPKHLPETESFERAVEIMQNFGLIRIYSCFKVFNSRTTVMESSVMLLMIFVKYHLDVAQYFSIC